MPRGLKSTVRLFADDTISYLAVTSEADAVDLQSDLNKLGIWENKKWKIEFHPDKCNVLAISKKANPIKFEYKLHGQTLKSVNNAKYLAVSLHQTSAGQTTSTAYVAKPTKHLDSCVET